MRRITRVSMALLALVCGADAGATGTDMVEARALYIQECSKCHGKNAGQTGSLRPYPQGRLTKVRFEPPTRPPTPMLAFSFPYGPSLQGIVGRKAGTAPGYQYSKAFMNFLGDASWVRPVLDAYLFDSQAMAPGIIMFYKQPDPEVRRKIIDYLEAGGG